MQVYVGGTIDLVGFTDKQKATLKAGLRIPNQLFFKMRKMGKPFGHIKEFHEFYEESKTTGVLKIGRGNSERIKRWFEASGINPSTYIDTVSKRANVGESTISLRDYQKGIPERIIESDHGLCVFSTGFGKSLLALKVAELLQERTLIIVPRKNIYAQFAEDVKTYFGYEAGGIEELVDDSKPIVIATVAGLQRRLGITRGADRTDVSEICRAFGCVIVDECDRSIPAKSRAVVESFRAKHRYGFTATPRRTDGTGKAIEWTYGKVIAQGEIERASPTVRTVSYEDSIPVDEYYLIIEEQTKDEVRNKMIADIAAKEAGEGRRVLILTKRIAHYEAIADHLKERGNDDGTYVIASGGSEAERSQTLRSFRDGTQSFQILLGTFSLLSTGVDIPSLDTLIVAGDLRSDVLAEQSAGRILRLFRDKKSPTIIDIRDIVNPILRKQSRDRDTFYRSQHWPIEAYG